MHTTADVAMADMAMADMDAVDAAEGAAAVAEDMVAAKEAKTKIMIIAIGMSTKARPVIARQCPLVMEVFHQPLVPYPNPRQVLVGANVVDRTGTDLELIAPNLVLPYLLQCNI